MYIYIYLYVIIIIIILILILVIIIYIYYIYHHDYDHSMCQQCVREMALCLAHHEYFPCHLSVVCAQCAGVNHLKIEYYIINIP
jgi:uncharacterized membrane protein